jgi:UDP-N-acetylmuramyl pentapeptide phosphotransferase/UDP-N-acetylglucosamine-1-phosphate transferase
MAKPEDPVYTIFTSIGASIFGGAVAGYILLKDQSLQTYWLLLIMATIIMFLGLISWIKWHKKAK